MHFATNLCIGIVAFDTKFTLTQLISCVLPVNMYIRKLFDFVFLLWVFYFRLIRLQRLDRDLGLKRMSTQGLRVPPIRGYRRRKAVLDLNVPPVENRDHEGTSTQAASHGVQSSQQGRSVPPTMIDVEAIDDDVIESSPTAFAEVCFLFFFAVFYLFMGSLVL